jgi:aspartyl-tRNA(Asn)/glutamyl-tRNA(Gln) amidotransferase subunit B
MRTKEDAADYRYFPDPDLPPLVIARSWVDEVKAEMPELPDEIAKRYVEHFGLTPYAASQLTSSYSIYDYFERASIRNSDTVIPIPLLGEASFIRRIAVWVSGEVSRKLNEDGGANWEFGVSPLTLGRLALREHDGTINTKTAKELFNQFWDEDRNSGQRGPDAVDEEIETKGLKQMNDSGALEKIIDEVMAANAPMVEQFRAGKDKAFNALVGLVMKASKGKANPQQANDLLRQKLQ